MSTGKTTYLGLHRWEPDDDFLRTEFNENSDKLDAELQAVQREMTGEFSAVRGEVADGLSAVRGEAASGFSAVRGELESGLTEVRGELANEIAAVESTLGGKAASSHKHAAGDITSGTLAVARGGTGNSSVDTVPTSGSTKMVTSGGVYTALSGKAASSHNHGAGEITSGILPVSRGGTGNSAVDTTPTSGSTKMVTSGGIYTALSGKANSSHNHGAGSITSGTLPVARGGTGVTSLTNLVKAEWPGEPLSEASYIPTFGIGWEDRGYITPSALAAQMGVTKMELGSYVGTGTSGSGGPNVITFSFDPKIVFVYRSANQRITTSYGTVIFYLVDPDNIYVQSLSTNDGSQKFVSSYANKTLTFYNTSALVYQQNEKGHTYYYYAIG